MALPNEIKPRGAVPAPYRTAPIGLMAPLGEITAALRVDALSPNETSVFDAVEGIMMTSDLWALVAAILLASGQLTIASVLTLRQLGGEWVAGPRDTPREVMGISGRFVRAHRNLLEIFPQFVAALFIVHAAHAVGLLTVIGAWTFVFARFLYVPAYAFAPSGIRPICWMAAWGGIVAILADLFW